MLRADITQKVKPEFAKECKEPCAETQKRRRLFQQALAAPEHLVKAAKTRREQVGRRKNKIIAGPLTCTHRNKVEETHGNINKVWKLAKWTKNRGDP